MVLKNLRPTPGSVPPLPGVYQFRDEDARVIYVGKATNLRNRLANYFQTPANLHPRTAAMVDSARSVDWVVVATETEALQLEYQWIKEYAPRFNVKYRDDKSYPYLAVTLNDAYPRVLVMRGDRRKGVKYFGPYAQAWAIRETVDQVLRVFPVRTCTNGVFRRAEQSGRPCLLGYIAKCSAPCVGRITQQDHARLAADLVAFLGSGTDRFLRDRERLMKQAATDQDYEAAARYRDDLFAMRKALERTALVLPTSTNADVIGMVDDELEAAVQIFHIRSGRVRGQRGFVVDKIADESHEELITALMLRLYGEPDADIPRDVLTAHVPSDPAVEAWLIERAGHKVRISVPQRGPKRQLLQTVNVNAKETLTQHKLRRSGDLSVRASALEEIGSALEMTTAPLRIECIDISNLQGSDVVGSLVVFEDGLPRKSDYRRYALRHLTGQDDVGAIREVVHRRFSRYLQERQDATDIELGPDDAQRSFRYPPNLLLVDGGRPQVNAAAAVMAELGIDDIAVAGLAKRLEEVWLPEQEYPVILSRQSQGLYLLQRIRDEAHRFAISYHRQRRNARVTLSSLEDIPGVGPGRRKALISTFGSLKRLRAASVDEVAAVPGVSADLAKVIVETLATAAAPEPAINVTTGEVVQDEPAGRPSTSEDSA